MFLYCYSLSVSKLTGTKISLCSSAGEEGGAGEKKKRRQGVTVCREEGRERETRKDNGISKGK